MKTSVKLTLILSLLAAATGKEPGSGLQSENSAWGATREFGDSQAQATDLSLSEVEALLKSRLKSLPPDGASKLALHLFWLCRSYGFSAAWVLSLIHAESGFRLDAKSPAGALGLMQLMPGTAQYIAQKTEFPNYRSDQDLLNPFVNTTLGLRYLAYLRDRFPHRSHLLAAYNLGPARLEKLRTFHALKIEGVKDYVARVQSGEKKFRKEGRRLALAERL